jgi:hypothetical protein
LWFCRDLSNNGIAGAMPTELGLLTALIGMKLYANAITGAIPTQLGQMTALERV